jgi:hypothetical protein
VVALGVVSLVAIVIWVIMVYVARMRTWMGALGGTCMACLVGSAIGSATVYIAIDHNPQEEFVSHATGAVNYAGLSAIFLSWFVIVGVAASLTLTFAVWAVRGLRALYRAARGSNFNLGLPKQS